MNCSPDGITVIGFLLVAGFIALMGGALSKNIEQRKGAWKAGVLVATFGLLFALINRC
jgi:hypothetical protein